MFKHGKGTLVYRIPYLHLCASVLFLLCFSLLFLWPLKKSTSFFLGVGLLMVILRSPPKQKALHRYEYASNIIKSCINGA